MSTIDSDFALELHVALGELVCAIETLVDEVRAPVARTEDVDLTVQNPACAMREARAHADEAVQVDNPYAVTIEVRASSDGGGEVIMRVPAHTTRVITKKVGPLSLRAIGGAPAGAIPATVTRYDKPQPAGVYPYAP